MVGDGSRTLRLGAFGEIEMASITGWEGSQARYFSGVTAAKAVDDLRHDAIELIGGGGGRNPGCPGEAADEGGLFHGVPMVGGVKLATADSRIFRTFATY
jgi:hypothetical protein